MPVWVCSSVMLGIVGWNAEGKGEPYFILLPYPAWLAVTGGRLPEAARPQEAQYQEKGTEVRGNGAYAPR